MKINLAFLELSAEKIYKSMIQPVFTCCGTLGLYWSRSRKSRIKVARYSFFRSIPPKFERKLRRHKQRFGKIDTTVVLGKEENWL